MENKIKAVRLSDDELENVSGGEAVTVRYNCCECGRLLTEFDLLYLLNGESCCLDCFGAAQDA